MLTAPPPAISAALPDAPVDYALLHRQYWQNESTRPGTRYVMLLAFVINAFNSSKFLADDIQLIGLDEVRHQLAVSLRMGGATRTALIECRHFDISSCPLAPPVLTEFASLIERLKPDAAIVLSAGGFTSECHALAHRQHIELADLKPFLALAGSDVISAAPVYRLHEMQVTEPAISLKLRQDADIQKLHRDMTHAGMSGFGMWKGEPVFLNLPEGRIRLDDFVARHASQYPEGSHGPVSLCFTFHHTSIEIAGLGGVALDSIRLDFEVLRGLEYYESVAGEIARLTIASLIADTSARHMPLGR